MKELASFWAQVWPNLAGNVLWVPLAALHHSKMKKNISRAIEARLPHREPK